MSYIRFVLQVLLVTISSSVWSQNASRLLDEADSLYAVQQYQEAYDDFIGLTKTPMLNPELYYEAAQCLLIMKRQPGMPSNAIYLTRRRVIQT